MQRAIELARCGLYTTTPNPRVGCVIVKDGQIIAEGYHHKAGEGHAEVNALAQINGDSRDAICYVTLEPCSHTGRTGPCAQALINAKPAKVVIGMQDPNPQVSGRGIAMLEQAGIEVVSGVLEEECKALNPGFIKRMQTGKPWVRLKLAMSLDGRTAMASGESQWITGPAARQDVQKWRAQSCAVVTGFGTWQQDNPQLTVRELEQTIERQPIRVLLDSNAQADTASPFFNSQINGLDAPVWWCTNRTPERTPERTLAPSVSHHQLEKNAGGLNIRDLLAELVQRAQVNEVLFECGATLAGTLIEQKLVDELIVYVAPKLMGQQARPLVALELDKMAEAVNLRCTSVTTIGDDIRLIYQLV